MQSSRQVGSTAEGKYHAASRCTPQAHLNLFPPPHFCNIQYTMHSTQMHQDIKPALFEHLSFSQQTPNLFQTLQTHLNLATFYPPLFETPEISSSSLEAFNHVYTNRSIQLRCCGNRSCHCCHSPLLGSTSASSYRESTSKSSTCDVPDYSCSNRQVTMPDDSKSRAQTARTSSQCLPNL